MDDQTTIASAAGNAQASAMPCTELAELADAAASRDSSLAFDRRSWLDLG
jgi:hypothetical protein